MHPTLFSLRLGGHDLGLHTYGVLVAAGFTIGIVLFWREGRRQGMDGGRLLDLSFWSIIVGLVGSRLAFVALNAGAFVDACFGQDSAAPEALSGRITGCAAALRFWEGGFVFYGGAVGTGLVLLLFCRREGWSFWRIGDLAAPTLALGHAVGRLGCFFAGCCFGKACLAPWGVSFPSGSVAHDELQAIGVLVPGTSRTPPLHPTQLYEAAGELAIFLLLLALRRRRHAREAAGRLLLTYAGSYALLRFGVEIFRGDSSRRYLLQWAWPRAAAWLGLPPGEPLVLSVSQFTSLLMLAAVGGALWWRRTHVDTRSR